MFKSLVKLRLSGCHQKKKKIMKDREGSIQYPDQPERLMIIHWAGVAPGRGHRI